MQRRRQHNIFCINKKVRKFYKTHPVQWLKKVIKRYPKNWKKGTEKATLQCKKQCQEHEKKHCKMKKGSSK